MIETVIICFFILASVIKDRLTTGFQDCKGEGGLISKSDLLKSRRPHRSRNFAGFERFKS